MIRHTSLQTASTIPSLQEKEELLNLNSRFSAYIQLVREMHEKDNSLDSTELFKAMQKFENDLNNLKLMYEKELEKLREQLDVLGREKDHYCLMYGKSDDLAKELNIKLQAEIDNSTKLVDEINILQRKITELEKELIDLHQLSQQPIKELAELHRHLDTVKQELQGVRKKHEREQMMRQEAENKLSRLKEKLHFQERIAEQQIQELRDQLQKTSATILGLEMRVRELSKSDNSTLQLLKKVQETAQEELLRYKKEAEAEYSKNLTALKIQLDNSTFLVENLTLDKYRLQDEVAELLAKISELEGQLASIEHQNNNLEDLMIKDRNHAAVQIHQLEKKLRELQDLIYLKLQEARNTRVPMMTEIKAFQLLLEEEEKRIQCPPMPSTMTFPVTPSKGMSYKSASSTSELVGPVMTSTSRVTTSPGACNMGLLQGRSAPQVTSKSAPKITSIQHQAATHASSPRVTFKMTPNVNRLSVDRAVSAPPPGYIKTMSKYKVKQKPTGQGPEYFQELFGSQTTRNIPIQHLKTRKPSHYNHQTFTSSATGDLRVVEVNKDGKYVRIVNQTDQDIEIDNYSIQQKVGDYPVAVFRFPPQTKIASCSSVTVWSRQNDALLHQPPAHFVWRQQDRWGSGPEFVTLLCTPCGKVIAWMTAAHRFNKNLVEKMPANQNHHTSTSSSASEDDETTCPTKPVFNGSPKPQVLFQPRKKEKHKIHSFYVQGKNSPGLKDMASNNTQVTFCTNNNCSLEKNSLNINDFSTRQTSPENKKSLSDVDFDATADRPSAFMRPRVRFNVGFQQIRSQHNENFRPPMPKPFSSIP